VIFEFIGNVLGGKDEFLKISIYTWFFLFFFRNNLFWTECLCYKLGCLYFADLKFKSTVLTRAILPSLVVIDWWYLFPASGRVRFFFYIIIINIKRSKSHRAKNKSWENYPDCRLWEFFLKIKFLNIFVLFLWTNFF